MGSYAERSSTWNFQVSIQPPELNGDSNFLDLSLAIPVCVTVLSVAFFALQEVRKVVKRLRSRDNSDAVFPVAESIIPAASSTRQRLSEHIKQHGGRTIFSFKIIRLVGACILFGLFTRSLVLEIGLPEDSLIRVASQCACFTYALLLAVFSIILGREGSVVAIRHLNAINLLFFGAFAFRDLLPLATLNERPLDNREGNLLWAKIAVLFVNSIAIPLLVPRQYIPVDPKNPSENPNIEQTASILSLVLYTFLDSIIFLAYRIPHLPFDLLPPLADYDEAKYLTDNALPHLDAFRRGDKRHVFWGLMRVFRREYIILATMAILQTIASFASPVGIKQLLHYLETGGEGAHYRPWVWISWLFLGPMMNSIAFQWYIFIGTRTMVRAECIITQLIFEHSLRVRMKAEVDVKASPSLAAPISGDESDEQEDLSETQGESSHSASASAATDSSTLYSSTTDATVSGSSSSVSSKEIRNLKKDDKALATPAQDTSQTGSKSHSSAGNLVGKINNLVTTDMQNIINARSFILGFVETPLSITLSTIFLYDILGWSAFVGLATILLLFPITGIVANQLQVVQKERLKRTDSRVQTVTETMNVVRMVKLFGWESKLADRLGEKREEELVWLWKKQMLELVNGNLKFVVPIITMLITFSCYSMAVFDLLREQLGVIYYTFTQAITGKVSVDRVNDFLQNTELLDEFVDSQSDSLVLGGTPPDEEIIGFHDVTFIWSKNVDGALTPSRRDFALRIPNELVFKRGRINLIVGPTGSGKTSLLMALLGEMHFLPPNPQAWFSLPRSRGVAYAAQESWVLNETIKDNILFGSPYDERRYKKVLYQCSLEQDLQLFEAGDATEVGEKGLTLSGGQKARLTLARAVYSAAEILLLDDVFAALDVHTAKWIVEKCFKGDLLQGRTVLLVTHNAVLIRPIASFCAFVGIDGVAQEQALEDLSLEESIEDEEQVEDLLEEEAENQPASIAPAKEADGKLIAAEEVAEGHVGMPSLMLYFRGLGGNHSLLFFTAVILSLVSVQVLVTVQTWYLGYWASQYESRGPAEVNVAFYLGVYGLLVFAGVFLYCISYTTYMYGVLRASRSIHQSLVESVLGTTLRWLDVTPISRVLTRCTQDIRTVDGQVAMYLWSLAEITSSMVMKFIAVIALTPSFLLPGIVTALVGGWCGQVYMKAQLSVKREMSNAKAPVIGHFGAAIAGLTSLRAYGAQESFKAQSYLKINRYTRAARTVYNLNRWVSIRVDAIGGLFASGLAAVLIYGKTDSALNTGFSINMAVGFSALTLWWVRMLNAFEVEGKSKHLSVSSFINICALQANSLERIQAYIEIEQEPKATKEGVPPAFWPASGELHVENLSARYSRDGPRVLHDLSFHIKSGERIGVVGRTGSGKSSLTLSLLRCIPTEGHVVYDGMDTKSVNLDALRGNITIIPQIPELLSGSLRENLDPFDQYDDATLNDALRAAGLFALQSEMTEGRLTLDSAIASAGGNLSVGQRQIIALARAIVRGSKLLILDEATSAIDFRTDSIIQSSLRNELRGDVTLITIAHRLQTIMDADKIMVLDAGRLVEFGPPSELLKDPEGKLRSLVDESGDRDLLYEMVKQADRAT